MEVAETQSAIPFDVQNVELGHHGEDSLVSKDDHDNMAKQFYVYDALFAYCKSAATIKSADPSYSYFGSRRR